MYVLFAHPRYPGQFGLLGRWLAARRGWRTTFLCSDKRGVDGSFEVYRYDAAGVHPSVRGAAADFARSDAHGLAAARTLRGLLDKGVEPDLIVFHSGFGVGRYLGEVTDIPRIGLFEWYPDPIAPRVPYRPATAMSSGRRLTAYGSAAGVLLDLLHADAAWTSAANQRARFPQELQHRLRVVPDGYDAAFFRPGVEESRTVGVWDLPDDRPIVSFASRGLEAERGFDVFMEVAARVQRQRPETLFLVVGGDEHIYGPEPDHGFPTYREFLVDRFDGDASQVWFQGIIPPRDLLRLFRLTTVHTYLSDPYVLSWSPRHAMASGALLVASDHAASRDLVEDGVTGLLAPGTDPDALAARIVEGIDHSDALQAVRDRAASWVRETSDIDVVGPELADWFETISAGRSGPG